MLNHTPEEIAANNAIIEENDRQYFIWRNTKTERRNTYVTDGNLSGWYTEEEAENWDYNARFDNGIYDSDYLDAEDMD